MLWNMRYITFSVSPSLTTQSIPLARACKAYYEKNKKYMEPADDSRIPKEWLEPIEQRKSSCMSEQSLMFPFSIVLVNQSGDIEIEVSSSSESWLDSSTNDEGSFDYSEAQESSGSDGYLDRIDDLDNVNEDELETSSSSLL